MQVHQLASFGQNTQQYHQYADDYGLGNLSLSYEYSSEYSNSNQGYQGYGYFLSNYENFHEINHF